MTDPRIALVQGGPSARFLAVARSPHVDDGVAARLADPLWMLARQWQLGEFRGDDAGSLVSLDFQAVAHMPTWWRPEPDGSQPTAQGWQGWTVQDGPLEAVVDAEADDGVAALRLRIEGGVAARRALCGAGLAAVAAQLPAVARWSIDPKTPPNALDGAVMAGTPDAALLDGFVAPWADPAVPMPASALEQLGVSAADADAVAAALRAWRSWWITRSSDSAAGQDAGPVDPAAWDASRLEYRGSLAFASAPNVRLSIDRHPGGPMDWYSADIVAASPGDTANAPAPPANSTQLVHVRAPAIPQPARLAGMPSLRFWEYEDAEVDYASIDADPADLARLLLVDYTTVYDHNWYYAPIRVPVGALVESPTALPVTVVDSFGIAVQPGPLAERSAGNTRMFTPTALGGATVDPAWSARWFWFAPRLAETLDSDPVEQVVLRRDEAADLGWATIVGTSDRYGRHSTATAAPPADDIPPTPAQSASATALYTLRTPLPNTWRALEPTPTSDATYLLSLDVPDATDHPVICRLLAAAGWAIHEEELGNAGLTLTRTRSLGRWYGGGVFTWSGRTVWPGGGTADSGLTWDFLR